MAEGARLEKAIALVPNLRVGNAVWEAPASRDKSAVIDCDTFGKSLKRFDFPVPMRRVGARKLEGLFAEGARLEKAIRESLGGLGYGG